MRILVSTVFLLAMLPADAALYRWVDERGVVHFSDQPPPRHAEGTAMSLDVPQPASGTTPLSTSITERSRAVSANTVKKPRKKRRASNKTRTAKRSTSTTRRSSRSSNGNTRRITAPAGGSGY